MDIPELLESCEKSYAVLLNARQVAQNDGDNERVVYYSSEILKTEDAINKLRGTISQEPISRPEPNFDTIVDAVAERLKPTAETVPTELKDTLKATVSFLDTIVEGDGVTFFGKGLTVDKEAEVKVVQDELGKWAK